LPHWTSSVLNLSTQNLRFSNPIYFYAGALLFGEKQSSQIHPDIRNSYTHQRNIHLSFYFFSAPIQKYRFKKILFWGILQIFIYYVIRLGVIYLFRNNPGTIIESHLKEHLNTYLQFPELAVILFFILLTTAVTILLKTQDKTNFLQNSLNAIGNPTFILYLLFGMPFEIHFFLEAYPSLFY
jgi:NADH:ubiquinone oxidoreductase subunit 6 (subunit J)